MAFYDRLKQARKNAGMTQEGVATLLGIAKSTYSGYETGKSEPPMNAIANLMRLYSVSADWLWQDEMREQIGSEHSQNHTPQEVKECYARSQNEIELLHIFRTLSKEGQEHVLYTAKLVSAAQSMKKDSIDESRMKKLEAINEIVEKSKDEEMNA